MLFGPGGVVALVLGAWSVLWALRAVPGRHWRAWYPTAALLAGAMFGFALLSAHTETVLAVVDWVRAAPEERDAVRADALAIPWKPLLAATLGTLALGVTAALAARGAAPAEGEPPPLRAGELALVAALALLTLAGVVTLAILRGAVADATTTLEAALAAAARLEAIGRVGGALALAELGLALAGGAWRGWRTLRG